MDSRPDISNGNRPIEEYLQRLDDYLYGSERRQIDDTIEEIRQHLHARRTEFMERGFSAEDAAQMALQRFGELERVAPSIARRLAPYPQWARVNGALYVGCCLRTVALVTAFSNAHLLSGHGILWSLIAPFVAGMLAAGCQFFRSVAIRPKCIAVLREGKHELRQLFSEAGYEGAWNILAAYVYVYLGFLLLFGLGCFQAHWYAMACFFALESIEVVGIKIMAGRIGRSVRA